MNTKEREQFLLMFLPACLVVITYAIFFYSPSQKTAQAARSQLEDVRQKAPTEQDLLTAKNLLEVAPGHTLWFQPLSLLHYLL